MVTVHQVHLAMTGNIIVFIKDIVLESSGYSPGMLILNLLKCAGQHPFPNSKEPKMSTITMLRTFGIRLKSRP